MKFLRLGFAVASYLLFFATFLYLVGFVGDFIVPRTIDQAEGPLMEPIPALIVNLGLVALFGIQHSVMARPGFKQALTKVVPAASERALYVLGSVIVLWAIFAFWQPMPSVVWSASSEWLVYALWGLFFAGWGIVFIATWLLNHFELFGLQQAWSDFTGKPVDPPSFRDPLFYKLVRHPIYTGFLIAFWAIPTMTVGHFVFALGMTVYIVIGVRYEERDLLSALGPVYEDYRRRVGMVIPGIGKAKD